MFYFQMTGGGLPSDDGSMPYCTFAAGTNQGNSAGQGEITGDSCFPIGLATDSATLLVRVRLLGIPAFRSDSLRSSLGRLIRPRIRKSFKSLSLAGKKGDKPLRL